MVEDRTAHRRGTIEEAVQGEATGGSVLESAQQFDLGSEQLCLVGAGCFRPCLGIRVVTRGKAAGQHLGVGPEVPGQPLPVDGRPAGPVDGLAPGGNRLGTEG